jgi:nitrous oxidase accessory protein NosD
MKTATVLLILTLCVTTTTAATITVAPGEKEAISRAMTRTSPGDTLLIQAGEYREQVVVNRNVTLRAQRNGSVTIRGNGRGVCVTLSSGNTIEGLVITKGSIGVLSSSTGNRIMQCTIHGNEQSGIVCIGHLPQMSDNVIVYNRGSGIQGRDLRSVNATIDHCTIAYNASHGISLGGNSDVQILNCIIAFNNRSDIYVEDQQARFTLRSSNLYRNGSGLNPMPAGNYSYDPQFVDQRALDFSLAPDSQCRRLCEDNSDCGARH